MPGQLALEPAHWNVNQADQVVAARGRQLAGIGSPGNPVNNIRMGLDLKPTFQLGPLPNFDGTRLARSPPSNGHAVAPR